MAQLKLKNIVVVFIFGVILLSCTSETSTTLESEKTEISHVETTEIVFGSSAPSNEVSPTTENSIPLPLTATLIPPTKFLDENIQNTPTLPPASTQKRLDANQAEALLFNWLKDNSQCILPCFLDIIPGETSAEMMIEHFSVFELLADWVYIGDSMTDYSYFLNLDDNQMISLNQTYQHTQGDIEHIIINAEVFSETRTTDDVIVEQVFDLETFDNIFAPYTLKSILSNHGIPANVFLSTLSKHPENAQWPEVEFQLILMYPEQGIFAKYASNMIRENDIVKGCFDNASIELRLSPSANPQLFWSAIDQGDISRNYIELEDAVSFSRTEFFQLVVQDDKPCIETPANIWRSPEN